MEEEKSFSTQSILFIMLIIVVVAVLGAIVLYVRKLPGSAAPVESVAETEEVRENVDYTAGVSTTTTGSIDVDKIRTLSLLYNDSEGGISFKYEFNMSNGSLLFSGWCSTSEGDIGCAGQKIATSRLRDITEILERYIVGSQVDEFIKNPDMECNIEDSIGNMEITLTDGRHASFGYPNGAGNAVAKYCRSLTEWLANSSSKE